MVPPPRRKQNELQPVGLWEKFQGPILMALVLLIILPAVYMPALQADFIWDDDDHFTENPNLKDFDGLKRIWTSAKAIYYPLTLTTWWLIRAGFGLDPFVHHLVTLCFHGLGAFFLYLVLRQFKIPGAWIATLLFALHPVQVESVAWATELKNTQSGVFFFLSIFLFFRAIGTAGDGQKVGTIAYALSLLACIAALLSKPSTVPLPGVLLVLVCWKYWRPPVKLLLLLAPYFILALASALWTIWEQRYHSNAQGAEWDFTLLQRILLAATVPWFYLQKFIWPEPLLFIYPRWQINTAALMWYLPLFAWLILIGSLITGMIRKPSPILSGALVAIFLFLGLLFPVLGFFNIYFMRFSLVADHFQYLAIVIPCTAAGFLVASGLRIIDSDMQKFAYVPVLMLVAVLGLLSHRHSKLYENEEVLWGDLITRNPNAWIGFNNLGYELARQERYEEAIPHYRQALALKPDYEEAFNNLGVALMETGDVRGAIPTLQKAVSLRENYNDAMINLGNAYAQSNRVPEALRLYERALSIHWEDPVAHRNLATIFLMVGEREKALTHLRESLRQNPNDPITAERLALIESNP